MKPFQHTRSSLVSKTVGLACLSLALVSTGSRLFAQTAAATSVAGVNLLQSSDSQFRTLLDANFSGISSMQGFDQMQPFLVLLVNGDALPKNAYAVRWTATFTNGQTQIFDKDTVRLPFRTFSQALLPGQIRLVSPLFSLAPSDYARMHSFSALFPATRFPQLQNVAGITASLDGVTSSNGVFTGQNDTKIRAQYACFATAEKAEGQLLSSLPPATSASSLTATLTQQITQGLSAGGKTDAASLQAYYTGELAQDLRNLVARSGVTATIARGNALAFTDHYVAADCSNQ